jgi:hypothetical protein
MRVVSVFDGRIILKMKHLMSTKLSFVAVFKKVILSEHHDMNLELIYDFCC